MELGNNTDRSGRGRPVSVTTKANVKKVRDRLRFNQARSLRKMAKERSMGRIVTQHLKNKAYKQRKSQLLSDSSKIKRKDRAQTLLRQFKDGNHRSILFTDEKVFTIEKFLNKQNDRIYTNSKPNATIQRTGFPKSVMVFAGITSDGKTPLIFVPHGIKVKGNNYLNMLKTQLLSWANRHFGKRR